jgi:hypothetical protein
MLEIDDTRSPLIFLEFRGQLTMADVEAYEDYWAKKFAAGGMTGSVVRAIDVPMPAVAVLKRLAMWVEDNKVVLPQRSIGTAMCLESAVLRGAVRFINTLAPSPAPQAVFSTWDEAVAWTSERLVAVGETVPR